MCILSTVIHYGHKDMLVEYLGCVGGLLSSTALHCISLLVWAGVLSLGVFYTKQVVSAHSAAVLVQCSVGVGVGVGTIGQVIEAVRKMMDPPISTQTRMVGSRQLF